MNKTTIRFIRTIHHSSLALLALFFVLIIITGILLSWKNNSGGYLMPNTTTGSNVDVSSWVSIDSIATIALNAFLHDNSDKTVEIDRIDIRPSKGIAKVRFKNSYYEIQIDNASGEVLSKSLRRSDFIEELHDGSILDKSITNGAGIGKLLYGSIVGLALLCYTLTGFLLWHNKRNKKTKRNRIV